MLLIHCPTPMSPLVLLELQQLKIMKNWVSYFSLPVSNLLRSGKSFTFRSSWQWGQIAQILSDVHLQLTVSDILLQKRMTGWSWVSAALPRLPFMPPARLHPTPSCALSRCLLLLLTFLRLSCTHDVPSRPRVVLIHFWWSHPYIFPCPVLCPHGMPD